MTTVPTAAYQALQGSLTQTTLPLSVYLLTLPFSVPWTHQASSQLKVLTSSFLIMFLTPFTPPHSTCLNPVCASFP